MEKIEEALVSYNHNEDRTLYGILLNGRSVASILYDVEVEKGNQIIRDVITFIHDGANKANIHDLIEIYLNDKKSNKLTTRNFDEEVVFLFMLGMFFLKEMPNTSLIRSTIFRLYGGSQNGEDHVTETIEALIEFYQDEMDIPVEKVPKSIIVLVITGIISFVIKLVREQPMLVTLVLMADSK